MRDIIYREGKRVREGVEEGGGDVAEELELNSNARAEIGSKKEAYNDWIQNDQGK